jgi:PAS domain S-box-containing protein
MSIGQKFTLWTVAILTAIAALSVWLYYRGEMSEEEARLERIGKSTGALIEQDLYNYMMTRDQAVLDKTLSDLTRLKTVDNLWVIDKKGVIRVATDKNSVGIRLSSEDRRCQRCHKKGQRGIILAEAQVFRWVQPVTNKPECHKCHQPSVKYNGIIVIDFDLRESAEHVRNDIYKGILVFISSGMLIGLVMVLLTKTLVVKRLNKAIDRMKRFKNGDYNVSIPPEGNDEITRLEENFNEMAGMIQTRDMEKDELILKVSHTSKEWQETFDNITDLISIHDKDFNIIKCNRAFAKQMGLVPDEIINKKCHEIAHGMCGPVENCPHKQTLQTLQPAAADVLDPRTLRTFRVSTFPYYSSGEDFIGTVHIARDVTEEREKEARLVMSERLASLGRMAYGIAHEINNPLAAIAGCTEGLLNRIEKDKYDPELFGNYLKIISEEIMRCKGITTGMLSVVRESTPEKKDIEINSTLDKTLEIMGLQGRLRDVGVLRIYKDGKPGIYGNEEELSQVFLAIITNALDAMGDKGTLLIETGVEGETVFIRIGDTGPGIPAEHVNSIFDPFFTTKADRRATGLGLSIAGKIMTNHNGSIQVISKEGKFTVMEITLPAGSPR